MTATHLGPELSSLAKGSRSIENRAIKRPENDEQALTPGMRLLRCTAQLQLVPKSVLCLRSYTKARVRVDSLQR